METGWLLILALFVAPAPAADPDDATKLAVKLTTEGAANFDRKDAKALAESYTEDANLTVITHDKDSDHPKSENKRGRGEIQAAYETMFKDSGTIHSKNTVEYARLIHSNLLVIAGVFEPGLGDGKFKVNFVQIRYRQDDKWLVSSMQIVLSETE